MKVQINANESQVPALLKQFGKVTLIHGEEKRVKKTASSKRTNRDNRKYKPSEDRAIRKYSKDRISDRLIGDKLGRTAFAIANRRGKLGVVKG